MESDFAYIPHAAQCERGTNTFRFLILSVFLLATSLNASAVAHEKPPAQLTGIELSLIDNDAIGFGTFQSHNQKVVSTPNGIFVTYIHKSNTNYTGQQWRLSRSEDGGKTFTTLFEDTHATSAPAIEADRHGRLFFCRPDFIDGNAWLYRLDPSRADHKPELSKLNGGAAGKYCLLLDEAGKQLYWFAHNNTFHIVGLDGEVRTNMILLAAGKRAVLQYPQLTLDSGPLFAAWTTSRPTGYLYHSVHAIKSPDGGLHWQSLDNRPLKLPIIADDTGPSTQISKDSEFDVHTWLSAFMVKDAKLHFVYWAETNPQKQWYRRYDATTGKSEIQTENIFGHGQEKPNDSGAFTARRTVPGSTLYFVSTLDNRKRLACLASDDNGDSWYEYASSDRRFPFRVYSIGTARDLTREGMIVGTFTDVEEKAKTYYEDHSGHVYAFRIQAGLCRADLREVKYQTSRLKVVFDEIRGQPARIRFALEDGSWSQWHPFTPELEISLKQKPSKYQLQSRLNVLSPPQTLEK